MQQENYNYQNLKQTRRFLVVFCVCLGIFMYSLDLTLPNIALPLLARSFNTNFPTVQWVIFSYLLASNSLVLIAGKLGDVLNKKFLYISGILFFILGSLLCGLSPSIYFLIACRVLQGLGGALIAGISPAIITEISPAKSLGRYLGMLTTIFAIGSLMGPGIGGFLISSIGWRSAFLINLPIGFVCCLLFGLATPSLKPNTANPIFQFSGGLIITVTLTCLTLALTLLEDKGLSTNVIILLLLFLCGLITFFLEDISSNNPIINLKLFRNFQFSLGIGLGVLVITSCISIGTILPFYLTYVKHYPAYKVGWILMTHSGFQGLSSLISGILCDRIQPRLVGLLGVFAIVFGLYRYSNLDLHSSLLIIFLTAIPCGIGQGAFDVSNSTTIMSTIGSDLLGTASGFLALTRSLGYLLGFSILGLCFARKTLSASEGLRELSFSELSPESLLIGYQFTFHIATIIIGVGVCLAIYLWWLSLSSGERQINQSSSITCQSKD